MAKLPKASGLIVATDTEGSGLFPDAGARLSAISVAWRDASGTIQAFATPFDQGTEDLPLGPKYLPSNHAKRIAKWAPEHRSAPNRGLDAYYFLMDWLSRQRLIMHHKKHDCRTFFAGLRGLEEATSYDLMPNTVADTLLREHVIHPDVSAALKVAAVRRHLGKELGLDEGAEAAEQEALSPWKGPQNDPRFDLIPWSVLEGYSRLDAILTLLLFEHQMAVELADEEYAGTQHLVRLIKRQEALSRTLYYMEQRGVGFDADWCLAQDRILARLEAEAKDRVPFRPTYPGAQKYFFGPPRDGGLGLLPFNDKLTGTGRPQVDEDVIERLIKLGTPGANEFAELMELRSARSKWYSAWPELVGPDGRLRTSYKQGYVISGRLSVEYWQAQAMPHDYQMPKAFIKAGGKPIRYGLTAREGYGLFEVDVSQAEIRVATAVAKCGPMYRQIKKGIDSHSAAALLMFYKPGTTLQEAMQDEKWAFNRGVPAKRSNLGILYGGGVGAIKAAILKFAGLDVPDDQVREWIRQWRAAFPPFVHALDNYNDLAARQGWVRLVDGSRRYFSEWEPTHKAFNQRIQGDVAIAVEIAMVEFDRLYPGMLLLQIHDSLVAEIPLDRVEEVTAAMRKILVETFERLFRPVPFEADVKPFGRTYYEMKEAAA